MAVPAAPEIINAVTMGLACCTTASTAAAPVNDWAPICTVSVPSWSAMTAPNGMATSAAGTIDTLAMNQNCSMNSRTWNLRLTVMRSTSRPRATALPMEMKARAVRPGSAGHTSTGPDPSRGGPDPGSEDRTVAPAAGPPAAARRAARPREGRQGSSREADQVDPHVNAPTWLLSQVRDPDASRTELVARV